MSRIAEKLHRLRKHTASMGFGFATASAERRRMLLVVRIDQLADDTQMQAVLAASDAAVAVPGTATSDTVLRAPGAPDGGIPVGVWLSAAPVLPAAASAAEYDFVVCDIEGPVDAVTTKGRGCLVRIDPGMEASRLRALADIGADAIVLSAATLDLSRLSSLVECRRAHTGSGKPIILHVSGAVDASQVVALWRAGVDALMADMSLGSEVLAGIRATINGAPFDARLGVGGGSPAIGTQVGALSFAESVDDDDGEEEDDE